MSSLSGRPVALSLLVLGLLFQGLSGLYGGGALFWDPTGGHLHMPLSLLEGSPFATYRIPGFLLLTGLGIGPVVVAVGLWLRQAWAWYGAVAVSGALLVWIGVQIGMVGYHTDPPLQLMYGALGGVLLLLSLRPSVRCPLLGDDPPRAASSRK
jgi:hypothetical protein